MIAISPLLNILSRSIRTIRKFVIRDFYEIEKLQSSIKKNNHFVDNSLFKLKNEVGIKDVSMTTNGSLLTDKKLNELKA